MPIYDPDTGEMNNAAWAVDTHSVLGHEDSIFNDVTNVVTKGIPLTGLSVVNSFANTAIEVGNFLGGDMEKVSIANEVGDGDLNDYYNAHKQGIETAGLIAGSLIPGTIAVKALKLAQAGEATSLIARATNIFAGPKAQIVEDAKNEMSSAAGLFNSFSSEKVKAIALGFGDQALQALTFNVATAATMKASPLLDDMSMGDAVSNIFYGTLVGAGIGGLIEGVGTNALFGKLRLSADVSTKEDELAGRLGMGNYIPGDKVATILDTLYSKGEPTTGLGAAKQAVSKDRDILAARKELAALTPNDKDVSNSVMDNTILQMKETNGLDKEGIYQRFARLDKMGRITDSKFMAGADQQSADIFYINKFAPAENAEWNNLVSGTPDANSTTSHAYALKPGVTNVGIARFSDKIIQPDGSSVPRFNTAGDAWNSGMDMFVDKKLNVRLNPDAPNIEGRTARPGESRPLTRKEEQQYRATGVLPEGSAPLRTSPVILNTRTGGLTTDAVPVVGDYGRPGLVRDGLQFGEEVSKQNLETLITPETAVKDANARYVWSSMRGILKGDIIDANDIPMLQQLHSFLTKQNDWSVGLAKLEKMEVTIAGEDGEMGVDEAFGSSKELMDGITANKNQLAAQLMKADSKMSAEEVALRTGTTEDYIANGLRGKEEDIIPDPMQDAEIKHVGLQYNLGNVLQQNDGMIVRGALDTQYRIKLQQDAADDVLAKFAGDNWQQLKFSKGAEEADIRGSGSSFIAFSNADYNTFGQQSERIGRLVSLRGQEAIKAFTSILAPAVNALRTDAQATAELGLFRGVRQRTAESYSFLPAELEGRYLRPSGAAADWQPKGNVAVLTKSLTKDKLGNITDWNKDYIPKDFFPGQVAGDRVGQIPESLNQLHTFYDLHPAVADFERAHQQVNDARIVSRNRWRAAQGLTTPVEPGTLYTPPIDTSKYSHFAYVRSRPGFALSDDSVAVIVGKDAGELQNKIAALGPEYSVYTKDMLKEHFQVEGDYQYNRNFAQSSVNSHLGRQGILNDIFPDTRLESILEDYQTWNSKQELQLIRDHVELGNGQLFAELRAMGDRFTQSETSQTGLVSKLTGKIAPNPYNDQIKTALNISKRDNYRLWADATEKVEAFADTAFKMVRNSFLSAKDGIISYEQASATAQKFGLGNPYSAGIDGLKNYYDIANQLPEPRILGRFSSAANAILGSTVIRLDAFQQLIHIVSTPVLLSAEAQSMIRAGHEAVTMTLPGTKTVIPSVSKLIYNGVTDFFNKDTVAQWEPILKTNGMLRENVSDYIKMADELTLPIGRAAGPESSLVERIGRAADIGAKLSGSNWTERFQHFVTAMVARRIGEGFGYEGQDLIDHMITFNNRVQGNYIASQRPVAFTGALGSALGLFQTYQANLMQQMFRYVGNGEARSVATLLGVQQTVFGLSSMPGFQYINNHIVGMAAGNPSHGDLVSAANDFAGKKLADYMLYGVASNWTNMGLYGRGDISPRQLSIVPINPLDFSAVAGGIRVVQNLIDTGKRIASGGSVPASLLLGLEHNGLSRPLAGLAQLAQGFSTTSYGSLITTTRDPTAGYSDLYSISNFSRILGARPLDEAVAMDTMYRHTLYAARDTARIKDLGEAAKTTLYGGSQPSGNEIDSFAKQYAAAGGNINKFGAEVMRWSMDANTSVANQIFRNLKKPANINAMRTMGGIPLPDFSSSGATTAGDTTASNEGGNQ